MSLECQKCEDNFCCIYLGQRTCNQYCRRQNCFCMSCQLYSIEEKSPAVYCQRCSFRSECYAYKDLGRINGRGSQVLHRHWREHCPTENCPPKDETTVELDQLIPPPDYSNIIQHVVAQEEVDLHRQGVSPVELEGGEVPIANGAGNPRMGPRVQRKGSRSKRGVSSSHGTRRNSRSGAGTRRSSNVRSVPELSSESDVGTRSTNRPCYRGM